MKTVHTAFPIRRDALALLCTLLLLPGCLRYVPSHEEVAREHASDGSPVGGEREFNAYENSLQNRLNQLVAQRAYLLNQGADEGSYRLGPGDRIAIDVYGFPDLKSDTEISSTGTVSLPLIGETHIGGQSVASARTALATAYSRFVRSPNIDLVLKGYEANRVFVIGEVAKPGVYPLKHSGQLVTELLSEAGGRTDRASARIVLIPAVTKGTAGEATALPVNLHNEAPANGTAFPKGTMAGENDASGVEVDLDDLIGGVSRRPVLIPLLPGDTIVVPTAGTFQVDGEVEKPGSYPIAARTSAISAVAAAGGFTYSADVNKVEVIRDIGNGSKALITLDLEEVGLRGGKDVRLRDGDLVRVPSESGRFYRRQIVESLNGMFRGIGVTARP